MTGIRKKDAKGGTDKAREAVAPELQHLDAGLLCFEPSGASARGDQFNHQDESQSLQKPHAMRKQREPLGAPATIRPQHTAQTLVRAVHQALAASEVVDGGIG